MSRKQELMSRVDRLIGPQNPHLVRLFVDGELYRTVEVPRGACSTRMQTGEKMPGGADMLFLINLDRPGTTDKQCYSLTDADTLAAMLQPGSPWLVMKT